MVTHHGAWPLIIPHFPFLFPLTLCSKTHGFAWVQGRSRGVAPLDVSEAESVFCRAKRLGMSYPVLHENQLSKQSYGCRVGVPPTVPPTQVTASKTPPSQPGCQAKGDRT